MPKGDYTIHYDPMFEALQTIDVQALIDEVTDHWYNQTLIQVGDVLVRLGVMQGEFHWHTHQDQDEFFFVLDGRFRIELQRRRDRGARTTAGLLGPGRNVASARRPGPNRGADDREGGSRSHGRLNPGSRLAGGEAATRSAPRPGRGVR